MPLVHQIEKVQVTDNISEIEYNKPGKKIWISLLKECNNNKEKNKAKAKSLNSESIVAILDQSGINKSKTYLAIIDTEIFSHVMDKEVASKH